MLELSLRRIRGASSSWSSALALALLALLGCGAMPESGSEPDEAPVFASESEDEGAAAPDEPSAATLSPGARAGAAMADDPANAAPVLFGGQNGFEYLSDTWAWNGTGWQVRNPVGQLPFARAGHAMAYASAAGGVVMFGGRDAATYFGDTWTWTGAAWLPASPTTAPSPRAGAAMASTGAGEALLFGGTDGLSYLSDAWLWDGATWSEITSGSEPPARAYASMSRDASGNVVLFGGRDAVGPMNDTWVWKGAWTNASPALSPPARYGAALAYDAARGVHVLFGGQGLADVLGDVWILDARGTTPTWTLTKSAPPGRAEAAVAYDGASEALVLFGGRDVGGRAYDGTWTWSGSDWLDVGMPLSPLLAAGRAYTFARKRDGTLFGWGDNFYGQLGDGTKWKKTTPTKLTTLVERAAEVSAGSSSTYARVRDGRVFSWGSNSRGQLGDGTTIDRLTPVPVSALSETVDISAGYQLACAVEKDTSVWCWGDNVSGQLGDGTKTHRSTLVQVRSSKNGPAFMGAVEVAAGDGHACARKRDGTLWCWGSNREGQLGDGTGGAIDAESLTPVQALIEGVVEVVTAGSRTCARKGDGTLFCWGSNSWGQLGDGTTTTRTAPVQALIEGVIDVSAHAGVTCAVISDGSAWCWGYNEVGQLGDGTSGYGKNRTTPVQVLNLSGALQVAVGQHHVCARKADGTVWCWGSDFDGQRGDGTLLLAELLYDKTPTPAQIVLD